VGLFIIFFGTLSFPIRSAQTSLFIGRATDRKSQLAQMDPRNALRHACSYLRLIEHSVTQYILVCVAAFSASFTNVGDLPDKKIRGYSPAIAFFLFHFSKRCPSKGAVIDSDGRIMSRRTRKLLSERGTSKSVSPVQSDSRTLL